MKKFLVAAVALIATSTAALATPGIICNENSDVTNVRSGPSAQDYRVIDKLDYGYKVIVSDITNNAAGYMWVKIRYNSMRHGYPTVETGWVDGGNVCLRN